MLLIMDEYHMAVGFNKFARANPYRNMHLHACMHGTLAQSCQVSNIP